MADVMLKLESQYCVNMAPEIVKVTVLIQLANLQFVFSSLHRQGISSHQYMIPTAKPKASSTKVSGKSMSGPLTGLTETISAMHRITEKINKLAKR